MNARGLFDFIQKVTDLDMDGIAMGIGVPGLMLRNVLKHPAPWGLVPGPEVVSRLALAVKALMVYQRGPDHVPTWLHLSTIVELEAQDPFGGDVGMMAILLGDSIGLDAGEVFACLELTLREVLAENPEAMRKYAEWLCQHCRDLEADGLLPGLCWAPVPGVGSGVAPALRQ